MLIKHHVLAESVICIPFNLYTRLSAKILPEAFARIYKNSLVQDDDHRLEGIVQDDDHRLEGIVNKIAIWSWNR